MRIRATAVAILIVGHTLNVGAQRAAVLMDVTTVQVEPTVVPNPDRVKEDFAPNLVADSLINALKDSNLEVGESPVRAHIVLEEFSSGSTAKRMLVGLGAGRSTVEGRLIFSDASGRELANVRIRVRGNLLFSGYQGGNTQRRQATNAFEQKLVEEIARLKPTGVRSTPRPASAVSAAPAPQPAISAPVSQPAAPQPVEAARAGSAATPPASTARVPPPSSTAAAPLSTPAASSPTQDAKTPPAAAADPTAARAALEAGARAEAARDWPVALKQYERARVLDPSMTVFIDISIARVRAQTNGATESDALRRARQFDALDRRGEAIVWYERALEALPESDPAREVVKKRLSELKGGQ